MATVEYQTCDRCGEKINHNHKRGAKITSPRRIKIAWRLFQYVSDHKMELCGECAEGLHEYLYEKKPLQVGRNKGMNKIEEIEDTTDQARSYTNWFESEWARNGVDELVKHNYQLVYNVSYLLSQNKALVEALEEIAYGGPIEDFKDIARLALTTYKGENT